MHQFWKEIDQMARIAELTQFQKDIGLLGVSLVAYGGEFGPVLTDPLFDL